LGGYASLQNQVEVDPQEAVFEVSTQEMVVKEPPKYGERFSKSLAYFGLLVVKKTWLMCPCKATIRRPGATASSSVLNFASRA